MERKQATKATKRSVRVQIDAIIAAVDKAHLKGQRGVEVAKLAYELDRSPQYMASLCRQALIVTADHEDPLVLELVDRREDGLGLSYLLTTRSEQALELERQAREDEDEAALQRARLAARERAYEAARPHFTADGKLIQAPMSESTKSRPHFEG